MNLGIGWSIYRVHCSWTLKLWHLDSEDDPYTKNIGSHAEYVIPSLTTHVLVSGIRKGPYRKIIGSHAEYGIPSLATQALLFGIRRRPYTSNIGSHTESGHPVPTISGALLLDAQALAFGYRRRPIYAKYWITLGICDSQPDHSCSCIWNPKGTL